MLSTSAVMVLVCYVQHGNVAVAFACASTSSTSWGTVWKSCCDGGYLLSLQELLGEPVIAADGYTYEKRALQEWLKQHNNSPATGKPLQNVTMLPNFAIMAVLEAFSS